MGDTKPTRPSLQQKTKKNSSENQRVVQKTKELATFSKVVPLTIQEVLAAPI